MYVIAETPIFDDVKQKEMYRSKLPDNPPKVGTEEHKKLMQFALEVRVILHTVNDNEFQAAVTCIKAPENFNAAVENFPRPAMVLGVFADKKVALIQSAQGSSCRNSMDSALEVFPNTEFIIAVGVCYAFNREKYKLGDVLVSKQISNLTNFKLKKDDTVEDRGQTKNVEEFLSNTFCLNTIHKPQFKVTEERESGVHAGLFISYPLLIDNKTERDRLHKARPYAIGGEMEGGVLMQVMEKSRIQGIIVIKAVVDYADGSKEKQWQFTAALAAIHYVQSKLRSVNLPTQGKFIT